MSMEDPVSGHPAYEADNFIVQDDAVDESESDDFEALIADELAKYRQHQAEKYAELQAANQWTTIPLPSPDPVQQHVRAQERQQLDELDGKLVCQQERSEYVPAACQPDLQQGLQDLSAAVPKQRPYSAVQGSGDHNDISATPGHHAEAYSCSEESPLLAPETSEGRSDGMHETAAEQQGWQSVDTADYPQSYCTAQGQQAVTPAELPLESSNAAACADVADGTNEAEQLLGQSEAQAESAASVGHVKISHTQPSLATRTADKHADQPEGAALNATSSKVTADECAQDDPDTCKPATAAAAAEHPELEPWQVQVADAEDVQPSQPVAEPSARSDASDAMSATAVAAIDELGPSASQLQVADERSEQSGAVELRQQHLQGLDALQAAYHVDFDGEHSEAQEHVGDSGKGVEHLRKHTQEIQHSEGSTQLACHSAAATVEHSQPAAQSKPELQQPAGAQLSHLHQAQVHAQEPVELSGQQQIHSGQLAAAESGQVNEQHPARGQDPPCEHEQPIQTADDSSRGLRDDDDASRRAATDSEAQGLNASATDIVQQSGQELSDGLSQELPAQKQPASDATADAGPMSKTTATAADSIARTIPDEPCLAKLIAATPATVVEAADGDDDFIYQDDDEAGSSCGSDTPVTPATMMPVTPGDDAVGITAADFSAAAHTPGVQRRSSQGPSHRSSSCNRSGIGAGNAADYSAAQQIAAVELAGWEDLGCSPERLTAAFETAVAADTAATISPSPPPPMYHGKRPVHGRNRQAATPSPVLMVKYSGDGTAGSPVQRKLRPESAPSRRVQSPAAAARLAHGSQGGVHVGVGVTQQLHSISNVPSGWVGSSNVSQRKIASRNVEHKVQAWLVPEGAAVQAVTGGGGGGGGGVSGRGSSMMLRPASAERAKREEAPALARDIQHLQQQRLHAAIRPRPGSADAGRCRAAPSVEQRPNSSSSGSGYSNLHQQHFFAAVDNVAASPRTAAARIGHAADERQCYQASVDGYSNSWQVPAHTSRAKPGSIPWDDSPIPLNIPNSMPIADATQSYAALLSAKARGQGPGYSALASSLSGHPALLARPKTAGAAEAGAILREHPGFTPRTAISRPYTAGRGMQTALHSDQIGSGSNVYLVDVLQKVRQANTNCRKLGLGKQYRLGRGSKVTWQQQQITVEVWVLVDEGCYASGDSSASMQQQQESQYSWQLKSRLTLAQFSARYADLAARIAHMASATAVTAEDDEALQAGSPVGSRSCSPDKSRLGGTHPAGMHTWAASRARETVLEEGLDEQSLPEADHY